jgi:hypothetical protein
VPSPVVGRLFTGNGGALICERCAGSIVAGSGSSRGPGSAERSFRVERAEPLTQRGLQVTPPPRQGFVPPSGPHPLEPPFDALAARFDPTGPPPTDEVGARSEIASAFADLHERTADGRGLVNVEHGDELAGYAAVVEDGLRLMTPATVNVVEHVRFVDASHAVVWLTTMLLDGRPLMGPIRRRECRAVLVDGRWKVAYESVRELWALANVSIPPRDDAA